MRRIAPMFFASLLALSLPASAEDEQHPIDFLNGVMAEQCDAMERNFRGMPGMKEALASRPDGSLCKCVADRFKTSKMLNELRAKDAAEIEKAMEDKRFENYLIAKMSAEIFICVASELDTGADALKPAD